MNSLILHCKNLWIHILYEFIIKWIHLFKNKKIKIQVWGSNHIPPKCTNFATPPPRLCIPAGIPAIPRNPQEPGFQKKGTAFLFCRKVRKRRTDHKGTLKNTFLFCWNVKIRLGWDSFQCGCSPSGICPSSGSCPSSRGHIKWRAISGYFSTFFYRGDTPHPPPLVSAPVPVSLLCPIKPFKLPPITDSNSYLNLQSIILFYLCHPEFSTQRSNNALITDSRNADASCFWEGQIRVAVQEGSLCFF